MSPKTCWKRKHVTYRWHHLNLYKTWNGTFSGKMAIFLAKWQFFRQNDNFPSKMAIFPTKFVPSCTPPPNIHSIGQHIIHTWFQGDLGRFWAKNGTFSGKIALFSAKFVLFCPPLLTFINYLHIWFMYHPKLIWGSHEPKTDFVVL